MAQNLMARGWELALPSGPHAREATEDLLQAGAIPYTRGDAFDVCGVCLPTPDDVAEAIAQIDLPPGCAVVDFSTGHPRAARQIAARLQSRDVQYIDAPVSGSIDHALAGELTVWAGADRSQVRSDAGDLLDAAAKNVFYMGSAGAGSAMKLVNQIIHISNVAAIGEGLRFAAAQDLDLGLAVTSMTTSSADSAMLRRFGATIAEGNFDVRFALRLALKDVRFADAEAQDLDVDLPNLAAIRARMEQFVGDGHGDLDFSYLANPH